jgi:UDP-N-acetylmuramyl pentapeptide phosphotransferase/UDP-N-acetylglucosamine-1-phosphate transferase
VTSTYWWLAGLAAAIAAALIPPVILARDLGHDDDFDGIQKVHDVPTSRLGGAVVALAYLSALAVAVHFDEVDVQVVAALGLASLPVVLVGLWEDVTRGVHPWHRLSAAVCSAAIASWLAGGIIGRVDLPLVDDGLRFLVFALPVTWFMVAGACNAMNLIDGAHGLAGGTALMLFGGIAAMAVHVGDYAVAAQALMLMGAVVGYLVWNYPYGKVFLGDAGAYFLGFMYAELSILLINRNQEISAWFVIALAAYPIVETLYSIYRRKLVLRTESMQPDAGHLHSLVLRQLAAQHDGARPEGVMRRANARVAPRLWGHSAICFAAAMLFYNSTPMLIGVTLVYAGYYVWCYRGLVRTQAQREPVGISRRSPAKETAD